MPTLTQPERSSSDAIRTCQRCGKQLQRKRYYHSGVKLWVDESLQAFTNRKFCDRECHRPNSTTPRPRVNRKTPFEERHIPEPNSGCWFWLCATNAQGYAIYSSKWGRLASRYAYATFVGNLPHDKFVLHHCDNPLCVNPDHLFIGTQFDNMRDCSRKGRMHFGEEDGMAKLNSAQVATIRQRASEGVSQKYLATQFQIHPSQVSRIISGRRWSRG